MKTHEKVFNYREIRFDCSGLSNDIKRNCYLAIHLYESGYSWTIIDWVGCIRNGNGTRVFGGYVND